MSLRPLPAGGSMSVMLLCAIVLVAGFPGPLRALPRTPSLDVRLAMPDGAQLATSVWLPQDSQAVALPTLLRRTPYGRDLEGDFTRALNDLGYAVVSQDVRGRGASDGDFLPFFPDRIDGPATIAWIASQPWSNGRVGSWSGSAEGVVQFMALGEGPAALDCAFILMATEDVCAGMMPGGAWRTELTTAWMTGMGALDALAQWRQHEACDAWWDPARLDADRIAKVHARLLLIGGFYDIFPSDMTRAFRRIQEGGNPSIRDDLFLVLGPWTHGTLMADDSGFMPEGELRYPPDAGYTDYWADFLEFFEWCLKDAPRPAWAPVRYFTSRIADDGASASGTWWTSPSWPPPSPGPTTVFLGPDEGLWASTPTSPVAPLWIPVDPATPVPSVGGGNLTTPTGPRNQSLVDQMAGVAFFQSLPAGTDAMFEGDVRASIWASNSTEDVDVVVRLSQVTPTGRVLALADGIRRGRYLASPQVATALQPGLPTRFDVDLGPVAFVLPAGHQLRVAVSGTLSPRYEPNPGSLAPIAGNPAPVASNLGIHMGADTPSTITLPLISGALELHQSPGVAEPVPDTAVPDALGDAVEPDAPTADLGPADTPDGTHCGRDPGPVVCSRGGGCTAGNQPGAASGWLVLPALALLIGWRRRGAGSAPAAEGHGVRRPPKAMEMG